MEGNAISRRAAVTRISLGAVAAITGAVSSFPQAKDLLRGKTFVRYLH